MRPTARNIVPGRTRQVGDCATVRPMARNNLVGRTQEAKFRLTVTGDASYSKKYRSGTHPAGKKLRHNASYDRK